MGKQDACRQQSKERERMMKVWVLQGSYESEGFASVHLTEKGCALACIADVLQFLGVDDEETALQVMNSHYRYTETDGEQTEPFEWDSDKLKDMSREELWKVCLLYTSPSPRDGLLSRMPSSA